MKKLFLLFISFILPITSMAAIVYSPIGYWKTISDHTGNARTIIQIEQKNDRLSGKVLMGFPNTDGRMPDPYCSDCPGDFHNKRIDNLTILWGYEQSGHDPNQWVNGEILDPEDGKIYKSLIVMRDADTLEIRGYLFISPLGRSQTWHRVSKSQYLEYLKKYPQPDVPEVKPIQHASS